MIFSEQNTQMRPKLIVHRSVNKFRIKYGLQFVSSLVLPLVFGAFAFVIIIEQQRASRGQLKQNWTESELERAQERSLSAERYKNELFDTYIKDMAKVLERYNGSLTNVPTMATIARVKTLNIFRQLDPTHNIRIIRFLHEAGQLSSTVDRYPLDLSSAKLTNVDFRDTAIDEKYVKYLFLGNIFLSNATFTEIEIEHTNFARNQFRTVNFSSGQLNNVNFSSATLFNATFVSAKLHNVDLSRVQLVNSNFSLAELSNSNFSLATLNNVDFSSTQIIGVSFSQSTHNNSYFHEAKIDDADFSNADIRNTHFRSTLIYNTNLSRILMFNVNVELVTLTSIDFSFSQLFNVNFSNFHSFQDSNFSHAVVDNVHFTSAELISVDFSYARFSNAKIITAEWNNVNLLSSEHIHTDFIDSTIENVLFSSAILISVNFSHSFMAYDDFQEATCVSTTFDKTSLVYINFLSANLKYASFMNASFVEVDFSNANLYKADFRGSDVKYDQLRTALSIEGVILPNGTIATDPNLIKNGEAYCNVPLNESWVLENGEIIIAISDTTNLNCQFQLRSLEKGAAMSQRVDLLKIWDRTRWPYSHAVLTANMSANVLIILRGINTTNHTIAEQILKTNGQNISFILRNDMIELEVIIRFNSIVGTISWCDNVKLLIIYGSYLERTSAIPNLHIDAQWEKDGVTVVESAASSDITNELLDPFALFVDDDSDQTIIVSDAFNNRVLECTKRDTYGRIVAGGNGKGNRSDQLYWPTDVWIDKDKNNLIICDSMNYRVVQWSRRKNTTQGEILISSILCWGLYLEQERNLYVTDRERHEVKRYDIDRGDKEGTIVAGGHGGGDGFNQLNFPCYIFVDRYQTLYISDNGNHRVVKWHKNATEGIVVAGGQGDGKAPIQMSSPQGLFVDGVGNLYVVDAAKHRVTRWLHGENQGTTIVGGNAFGNKADQLYTPSDIAFDSHGHIYVVDMNNHRVQRFSRK